MVISSPSPKSDPTAIFLASPAFLAVSMISSICISIALRLYPKLSSAPALISDSMTFLFTLLESIRDTKSEKSLNGASARASRIELIAISPAPLIAPIPNMTTSSPSILVASKTSPDRLMSGGRSLIPIRFSSSTYLTTLSVLFFSSVRIAAMNSVG